MVSLVGGVQKSSDYTVSIICKYLSISRDTFYKSKRSYNRKKDERSKVLEIVMRRRRILPREGVRKLHKSIKDELKHNNIKLGRDKLFEILRDEQMLVLPKKSYHRTTNSNHRFYRYKNLVKEFKPSGPNQLWVSDITYIRMHKGHSYLALITDAYSRKIVGYDVSNSLELQGCVRALRMATKQLPNNHNLIHHSDRGIQYCSNIYTDILKKEQISISMTEENHCYENAMAERVNGILKDEFFLDESFYSLKQVIQISKSAINIYNNRRLHLSLDYKTPNYVHEFVT